MKTLYYIAIVPPEPIASEIKAFKTYAGDHFGSYHALRSPAHITLVPPFHWAVEDIERVKTVLSDFSKKQNIFDLHYSNFNCFEPRVVFVDVRPSEALLELRNALLETLKTALEFNQRTKRDTFHPHTTISYRYTNDEQFAAAWAYFSNQNYQATFEVKNIILFKHRKEIGWQVDGHFEF